MADEERKDVIDTFKLDVNMTAHKLEEWLKSNESWEVGQKQTDGGESTGHESGRHIVRILGKTQADYTDADLEHMRKVTGYIHRHLAQRPNGDVRHTRWRYSLMNWGHDPLK